MLVESDEIGTKVECVLCSKSFTARPEWMTGGTPAKKGAGKDDSELLVSVAPKRKDRRPKKKRTKKDKKKARQDEELEPDEKYKPSEDKFITCPECGKKLPGTAHICNQCGWNLKLGGTLEARRHAVLAKVLKLAVLAVILVLLGAGIGIAARYINAAWTTQSEEKAADAPTADTDAKAKPAAPSSRPKTSPKSPAQRKDDARKTVKIPQKPVKKPVKPSPKPVPRAPRTAAKTPDKMGIIDTARNAVVMVRTRKAAGLGFIVDAEKGLVATNRHLLEAGLSIRIMTFTHGAKERREFSHAAITAIHKKADVALVRFNPRNAKLTAVELADADAVRQGEKVFSVLRPSESDVATLDATVKEAKREVGGMTCLLTSKPIDAKNSGGALFSHRGKVLGINTYSTLWDDKSFVIDAAYIRDLLDDPESCSLSAKAMEELLKKGLDPLRTVKAKILLGRTVLEKPATKLLTGKAGVAVYALQPEANSIAVLCQNKVANTLFVGANPADFDVSPDGKHLCVAVNRPTGISVIDLKKKARERLVRVAADSIFAVRALDRDLAVVVCGVIYTPTMRFSTDKEPIAGVKVMVVNLKNERVEQEIENGVPLPILAAITSKMPKRWTRKNMDTKREWQDREKFAKRLFAFPAIGRSPDGKLFYVAAYDLKNSKLTAKDQFALYRYQTRRLNRPDVAGPDRVSLYVAPDVKQRTIDRKKARRKGEPALPEFAQFPQRMLVSDEGKTVLLGSAIIDGETLQLTGSIRRDEEAEAENPVFCNIQAVPSGFRRAFTGTSIFDVQTFTEIAQLPFRTSVLAVDLPGKRLYMFNPADANVYAFDVKALEQQ